MGMDLKSIKESVKEDKLDNSIEQELNNAILDFIKVSELARSPLELKDFDIQYVEPPHDPPKCLPNNKIAVYAFCYKGSWLKIGMVGPKSNARYCSQHYNPDSSRSNLAKSVINDPELNILVKDNPSEWIKKNCCRVNILLDSKKGILLLSLLEAFLHVRLKPRYEKG